jgi:glycosyltransferase involved in cell wall biosynthesis
MTISVIIITLNEEKYLPILLGDITNQTDLSHVAEILIVDGKSQDATEQAAKSFSNKLPIRFIVSPEKGWAQQKNYGANHARGDTFLFLDADLRIPKNLFESLVRHAQKSPNSLITPRVSADSLSPLFKFGALVTYVYFRVLSLFATQAASDQALLVSKKTFNHLGGFDETFLHGADLDFMARAKRKKVKLVAPLRPSVRASVRRYKQVGIFTLFFRYLRSEIHRSFNGGKITKDYIGYTRDIPVSPWKRGIKKLFFVVFASIITALVVIEVAGQLYAYRNRDVPITWGTSFSIKYADELGIPWQKAYTATVSELGVKHVRIMTYWDRVEPNNDRYEFQDIDWQIAEAKKHNAKVMLTVGLRQPRWPECHQAQWAADLRATDTTKWQKELDEYIVKTIQRYKNNATIEAIQLENEYMNRNFGKCTDFSRERLRHELALVRAQAPNTRIYITTGDQTGFPVIGPMGDSSGTSLYTRTWAPIIGYYNSWLRPSWYGARSVFTGIVHDQPMIISELQAEPWGPKATVELSIEEQNKSMSTQQLNKNFQFARDTGIKEVYTWGAEWWYWRKELKQDPSMWNEAKKAFTND